MSDLEQTLSVLLVDRAERVAPRRGHREDTMRRARRRRMGNASMLAAAVLAVAVGAAATVRHRDEVQVAGHADPAIAGKTHVTTGPYGFRSKEGAYPWVATGYFRGGHWELRAAAVRLEAGAPIRLTLVAEGDGNWSGTSTGILDYAKPSERVFAAERDFEGMFGDHVVGVFGSAPPDAETVDVELIGGDSIRAHLVEGYDAKTGLEVDYWVAFIPRIDGFVVARGAAGQEIDAEVIPPPP